MKTILIDADSLCFTGLNDTKEQAINKLINNINRIEKVYNFEYKLEFYLTFGKNFRHNILENYKANRVQLRSDNVKILKQYLIDNYNTFFEDGYEADDLVCDKYRSNPDKYIIASIDKDLLYNLPGKHLNLHYKSFDIVNVTEEEANYNLHKQIIIGDVTDNIPTLLKGLGPVKIKNIIDESGLKIEELSYYLCKRFNINYIDRYKLLFCGKIEDSNIELHDIEDNEIVNDWIDIIMGFKKRPIKAKVIKPKVIKTKKSNDKINFGKYKGKSIQDIVKIDRNYSVWLLSVIKDKELHSNLEEILNKK